MSPTGIAFLRVGAKCQETQNQPKKQNQVKISVKVKASKLSSFLQVLQIIIPDNRIRSNFIVNQILNLPSKEQQKHVTLYLMFITNVFLLSFLAKQRAYTQSSRERNDQREAFMLVRIISSNLLHFIFLFTRTFAFIFINECTSVHDSFEHTCVFFDDVTFRM